MSKEKKYEFCRLCGFVREVGKGGICPACGAPERAFLPFEHKASEKRRIFLKLDVHPVAVHFTISYTAVVALLYIISIFSTTLLGIPIEDTRDLQILFLPLLIVGGGITGVIDGKIRFRKIDTPYLKRKIILGSILFVLSLWIFIFHNMDTSDPLIKLLEGIFIFSSFAIASYLGWIGAEMMCAIVPVGRLKEK
ncbi:MAG: hypothetical protein ACXABI_04085 [Candidatus Hodarchaeales archaeon]